MGYDDQPVIHQLITRLVTGGRGPLKSPQGGAWWSTQIREKNTTECIFCFIKVKILLLCVKLFVLLLILISKDHKIYHNEFIPLTVQVLNK